VRQILPVKRNKKRYKLLMWQCNYYAWISALNPDTVTTCW